MMRRRHAHVSIYFFAWFWHQSLSFLPIYKLRPLISRGFEPIYGKRGNDSAEVDFDTSKYYENTEQYSWQRVIEQRTHALIYDTKIGTWDASKFEYALNAMETWAQRPSRKSAVNIERLLRRVVQEKERGNGLPDSIDIVTMYNIVITCWAKSEEKGAPQRAEEILDKMQSYFELGDVAVKPNITSFNAVLLAYSSSKRKDAAQQAMRILQKLDDLRSAGQTDVMPNTESYSTILKAYAAVGGPNAPLLVLQLIQRMEKLAKEGYPAVKPDYRCHNVYLGSLLATILRDRNSKDTALKAEAYLEKMLLDENEGARPDVWSWNMVISAWSKSGDWEMAERAEALVFRLEEYHEKCGHSRETEPNSNTYNCLIACYSRSKLRDKAQRAHAILDKMKEQYQVHGKKNQRPDAVTYNSVMNAYAKSSEEDAPHKVEALLREMYSQYETTGDRYLKPSSRSFNTCFDAWAKSNHPQAAERIMDWINHMQENFDNGKSPIAPNKWTYNAYLEALSKLRKPSIGDEAEKLLEDMDQRYKNGSIHLKPDVLTFTNVIHCIALSGADDAFERAYATLSRMENLHASGYGDVRPNTYTYNCVINAVAKSKIHAKSKIAVQMLQRMKHVALRPLTITYNNILNACAFSNAQEEDCEEVLGIALNMLKEAQETCGANFITYGTTLRVIGSFEEDPMERWRLARDTFRSCCADGELTSLVMNQVKHAVSPTQYALLEQEARDDQTGRLKAEHTRNVRRTKGRTSTKNKK